VNTIEELPGRKSSGSGLEIENMAAGIRRTDHVALSIRKSWHQLCRQAAVVRSYSSLSDSGNGVVIVHISIPCFSCSTFFQLLSYPFQFLLFIPVYLLSPCITFSRVMLTLKQVGQVCYSSQLLNQFRRNSPSGVPVECCVGIYGSFC
jgi:hypothetical protein